MVSVRENILLIVVIIMLVNIRDNCSLPMPDSDYDIYDYGSCMCGLDETKALLMAKKPLAAVHLGLFIPCDSDGSTMCHDICTKEVDQLQHRFCLIKGNYNSTKGFIYYRLCNNVKWKNTNETKTYSTCCDDKQRVHCETSKEGRYMKLFENHDSSYNNEFKTENPPFSGEKYIAFNKLFPGAHNMTTFGKADVANRSRVANKDTVLHNENVTLPSGNTNRDVDISSTEHMREDFINKSEDNLDGVRSLSSTTKDMFSYSEPTVSQDANRKLEFVTLEDITEAYVPELTTFVDTDVVTDSTFDSTETNGHGFKRMKRELTAKTTQEPIGRDAPHQPLIMSFQTLQHEGVNRNYNFLYTKLYENIVEKRSKIQNAFITVENNTANMLSSVYKRMLQILNPSQSSSTEPKTQPQLMNSIDGVSNRAATDIENVGKEASRIDHIPVEMSYLSGNLKVLPNNGITTRLIKHSEAKQNVIPHLSEAEWPTSTENTSNAPSLTTELVCTLNEIKFDINDIHVDLMKPLKKAGSSRDSNSESTRRHHIKVSKIPNFIETSGGTTQETVKLNATKHQHTNIDVKLIDSSTEVHNVTTTESSNLFNATQRKPSKIHSDYDEDFHYEDLGPNLNDNDYTLTSTHPYIEANLNTELMNSPTITANTESIQVNNTTEGRSSTYMSKSFATDLTSGTHLDVNATNVTTEEYSKSTTSKTDGVVINNTELFLTYQPALITEMVGPRIESTASTVHPATPAPPVTEPASIEFPGPYSVIKLTYVFHGDAREAEMMFPRLKVDDILSESKTVSPSDRQGTMPLNVNLNRKLVPKTGEDDEDNYAYEDEIPEEEKFDRFVIVPVEDC